MVRFGSKFADTLKKLRRLGSRRPVSVRRILGRIFSTSAATTFRTICLAACSTSELIRCLVCRIACSSVSEGSTRSRSSLLVTNSTMP